MRPSSPRVGEAEQHRVAHGVGHERVVTGGGERPAPAHLAHAAGRAQRADELLDEERQPLRAMVDGARERRGDGTPEQLLGQMRSSLVGKRLEHELVEPPGATEIVRRRRSGWPRGTSSER